MVFISSVFEGRVSQFHQGAAAAEWRRVVCLWNQRFQPLLSHLQGKHAKHYDQRGAELVPKSPTWSHYNSAHTLFLLSAEFHGFGGGEAKRWTWMDDAHVSAGPPSASLSLRALWHSHTQKQLTTDAYDLVQMSESENESCPDALEQVCLRRVPKFHQGKQQDARVKMRFNDLRKSSTGGELKHRDVVKRYTWGGRSRDIDILGSRWPKKTKTIKV